MNRIITNFLIIQPVDYEPPFFRSSTEQEAHNPWTKSPLKMEVGNVDSKHFVLSLKVKSVLDPCEDENDDIQDGDVILGANSVEKDEYSESDSEVSHLQDDQYIVVPIEKQQAHEDGGKIEEDDTQDPAEDEQQLGRVKDWISCYHLDTVELTDVLSNFPDISAKFNYKFNAVKEEMDGQVVPDGKKAQQGMGEDHMYMKALYHALPMDYITVAKLQCKLEGEVKQTTVRKLIDKMACDGFVEAKSSRRLGNRVIHSDLTEKMLMEAKKTLDTNAMDVDINESHKSHHVEFQKMGSNNRDMSTCGILQSIGSDLTCRRGRCETLQNGFIIEQTVSRARDHGNTSTSRAEVKEPILQYMKRQKSQAP